MNLILHLQWRLIEFIILILPLNLGIVLLNLLGLVDDIEHMAVVLFGLAGLALAFGVGGAQLDDLLGEIDEEVDDGLAVFLADRGAVQAGSLQQADQAQH